MSKIGILTTGGDCSGLNSVIRAAYIRSKILGCELIGIRRGIQGLEHETLDSIKLNDTLCDYSLLGRSGSILLSNTKWMKASIDKGKSLDDIKKQIYEGYKELELNGLICVGGDGSIKLINELLVDNEDINVVVVPKTIDNDVNYTSSSIGFNTVVENVVHQIDCARSTAMSHERTMIVEVMGRGAGFIAMYAGTASGADVILIPEIKYNTENLISKVKSCMHQNGHCIVVVSESVESDDFTHLEKFVDDVLKYTHLEYKGISHHFKKLFKDHGIETRSVVLGHTQRGGDTTANDRIIGSMFGVEAVNLLCRGESGKLLCYNCGKINVENISEVCHSINRSLPADDPVLLTARDMWVYIGEV